MKKIVKIMFALAVVLVAGVFGGKEASAEVGEAGYCGAKVYTDDLHYYEGSTTVDFYSFKSKCGKVYYKANIYQVYNGYINLGLEKSGYFTSASPIKQYKISDIKKHIAVPVNGAEKYIIVFDFYGDAGFKNELGYAESKEFYVY